MSDTELPSAHLTMREFAEYCFASLDAIAPERGVEVRETMRRENVQLDIRPDTRGLLFQVGRDRAQAVLVIETSPIACYLLWAVALEFLAFIQALHVSEGWPLPDGMVTDAQSAESAAQTATAALSWVEQAVTSGDMSGTPPQLPRRVPHPLPAEFQPDIELSSTEIALCAAGWIMHHELAHARLGHVGSGLDQQMMEKEADRGATDWLLEEAPPGVPTKKRSIGIAIAALTFVRLEERTGRIPDSAGRYTHPPAIERLHAALSDARVDGSARDLAVVALMRLLMHRGVLLPDLQPGASALDHLDDLAITYNRASKG